MTDQAFIHLLKSHSLTYVQKHPTHPDVKNIATYQQREVVETCLYNYRKMLSASTGRVLDVGSGVGFAKQVDSSVYTSDRNFGFFREFVELVGRPYNFTLKDFVSYQHWINTDDVFDTVILHKFYPWYGVNVVPKLLVNLFTGIDKVLAPGGILMYTPMQKLQTSFGTELEGTRMPTYMMTKQDIHYAIDTYKIL